MAEEEKQEKTVATEEGVETVNAVHEFDDKVQTENNQKILAESTTNDFVKLVQEGALNDRQIDLVVTQLHKKGHLSDEYESVTYGADFDIASEIAESLDVVKAMKGTVYAEGRLLDGVKISEAKDVMGAINSTMTTLMKNHEKIMNMQRFRAMEQSAIDTLREISTDRVLLNKSIEHLASGGKVEDGPVIKFFLDMMEKRLGAA